MRLVPLLACLAVLHGCSTPDLDVSSDDDDVANVAVDADAAATSRSRLGTVAGSRVDPARHPEPTLRGEATGIDSDAIEHGG